MLRVVLSRHFTIPSPSLSISWTRGYATTTKKKKVEEKEKENLKVKVKETKEKKERGKKKEEKKEEEIPVVSKKKKWGLFGDIHFDDRTLGRVVQTSEWILKTFKENNVTQIICMGDVLNTREVVSVQSLSAAMKFFDELSMVAPVNIILGNHDMNLKHSGKLSSLDVLDMRELRQRITLHRSISTTVIDDFPCVMLPYQENSSEILNWIAQNKESETLKKRIAFAHLSLEGAIQRYQKDNKSVHTKEFHTEQTPLPSFTKTPEKTNNTTRSKPITSITPNSMLAFKRIFSGHFHHHHSPSSNFVYVGAPMQHTYGDAGDSSRGVVIYEPSTDNFNFFQNPDWDTFRIIRVASESDLADAQSQAVSKQLAGKYVNMLYTGEMSMNAKKVDSIHEALLKNGAKEARKALATSFLSKQHKVVAPTIVHHSPEAVVPDYVSLAAGTMKSVDEKWQKEAIQLGQSIISEVTKREKSAKLQWAGETFVAKLVSVTLENFLGVREQITISPAEMRDGVWFLTGANGSGKSTLLEAVTWCLFDKFLRSDMKSDFAVNDTTKKNCLVRVAFDNGYEVERFRKHKEKGNGLKIYKDGKYLSELERGNTRDSQRVLEGLLGISFETFTKAVVLGDNAAMNFLMSDSKRRRETIEELLEMDIFDLFLTEARDRRKGIQQQEDQESLRVESISRDVQIRKAEMDRDDATRQSYQQLLVSMKESYDFNNHRLAEWEQESATLLEREQNYATTKSQQRIRDKWDLYQSNLRAHQMSVTLLEDLRKNVEKIENQIHQADLASTQGNLIESTSTELSELQGPMAAEIQADVARHEQQVLGIDNQIQKMTELVSQGKCPTCQQSVTHTKMNKPEQLLASQKTAATSALSAAISKQQTQEARVVELSAKLTTLLGGRSLQEFLAQQAQRGYLQTQLEAFLGKVKEQEQVLSAISDPLHVLADLKMPLEKIQKVVNSLIDADHSSDPAEARTLHQANHTNLLEEKFRLQSEVTRLTVAVEELERKHNENAEFVMNLEEELEEIKTKKDNTSGVLQLLDFWEKGFDKRTLKSAEFPTMRSYMLSQSVQDLNGILAQYSHVVGSGERLGISFNADLELNEDFGKRSAGQRKRNDIVIMLSLFELIRQRGRFRADFVMLDEVFDALDVNGQLAVQELLSMLAQRVAKVFVITHSQPHLMSKDANVIQVSMTPQGTAMDIIGLAVY